MTIDTATFAPIWSEEFDAPIEWGATWVGDRTSAYRYCDHNPDDDKLDWLDPGCVTVSDGVATFTATPADRTLENGLRAWRTGLLTTEYSAEGFRVRTGDHVETRVELPSGTGAWPALWTWRDGGNEVDSFEYHPDNPALLELSNHANRASTSTYWSDADAIAQDRWVTVGTTYGAGSVDWYVNGECVFSDGTGVGSDWSAYLVLNLSLSAGRWHPAPCDPAPITFAVDYLRVYREAARW
ncbi:beta-glucanase [Streptomyces cyaneochromogenes]|uniref:Beta-glucanase n=1 Tax=Streptomyces cyaneochromogenes TaxID=2496836 RepID=A0A3Q9ES59_9ACTN|nr:beta-glucanase [Streptomyces cyaneochromogenes]AZQ34863.1 beta-glucanase [Streptomyces cyaneochromogenes]